MCPDIRNLRIVEWKQLTEIQNILDTGIENDFKVTPEQIQRAITPRTRAILLCSPSNPTGCVYSKDELEIVTNFLKELEIEQTTINQMIKKEYKIDASSLTAKEIILLKNDLMNSHIQVLELYNTSEGMIHTL